MTRTVALAGGLAVAGLVVGYLIFGRVADQYVSVQRLLTPDRGALSELVSSVNGLARMRQNIAISGVVGLVAGLVAGMVSRRR